MDINGLGYFLSGVGLIFYFFLRVDYQLRAIPSATPEEFSGGVLKLGRVAPLNLFWRSPTSNWEWVLSSTMTLGNLCSYVHEGII